jgi:hypothetical protein
LQESVQSPRYRAALRRIWRALPDSRELPGTPRKSRSATLCPRGQNHTPELVETNGRAHHQHANLYRDPIVRCSKCHTTNVDPVLVAEFADKLSPTQLTRLLAHHWCASGHTYGEIPTPWCIRCGKYRHLGSATQPHTVTDPTTLLAAGIPPHVLQKIIDRVAF